MTADKNQNDNKKIKSLAEYSLLGRSGLRVSPLCLGTMTFGNEKGWGTAEKSAREIFDRYLEAGGNFIDTANGYTGGDSEKMLGKFMKDADNRDRLVLATKFTFNANPGDPNAGGNSRKHMMEAVDASLRRLQTDYIDLYWMHAWDTLTPAEEVMAGLTDLVRSGKIRYIGLSDVPAWYAARAQSLADWRGWEPVCALQLEYSLIERNIEREHVPAAQEFGMGICPWSPLASGLLTGKYKPSEGEKFEGEGRLQKLKDSPNPVFDKFTEKNWGIVNKLLEVAEKVDRSPAQVALNWITKRPGVTSTIIGATRKSQLEDNLAALEFDIPEKLRRELEEVSKLDSVAPYMFFEGVINAGIKGGTTVHREPKWYR